MTSTGSRARRVAAVVVSLVAAVAGGVVEAPGVAAHAGLVSSTPQDGATVTTAPTEVVLTFSEDINPRFTRVEVSGGGDSSYVDGDPSVEGAVVTQPVLDLPSGDYTIAFRVSSTDGHPVSDNLRFTVSLTATPSSSASTSPSSSAAPSTSTSSTASPSAVAATSATSPPGTTGTGWMLPALLGALAVLVVGALAVVLTRRRDGDDDRLSGPPEGPPPGG